jgi:hypothetical protein
MNCSPSRSGRASANALSRLIAYAFEVRSFSKNEKFKGKVWMWKWVILDGRYFRMLEANEKIILLPTIEQSRAFDDEEEDEEKAR